MRFGLEAGETASARVPLSPFWWREKEASGRERSVVYQNVVGGLELQHCVQGGASYWQFTRMTFGMWASY